MKRITISIVGIGLLLLAICFLPKMSANNEVKYDGAPLKIAVLGDIPELQNDKIHFKSISIKTLSEDTQNISTNFNALMITPERFDAASDDKFVNAYKGSEMPIIFFDSAYSHYPFVHEGVTYETAFDSTKNGSHSTIYLNHADIAKEDAWYFYLDNERNLNQLYTEIFEKIEEL